MNKRYRFIPLPCWFAGVQHKLSRFDVMAFSRSMVGYYSVLISLILMIGWLSSSLYAAPDRSDQSDNAWLEVRSAYHTSIHYENLEKFDAAIKTLSPVYKTYPKGYTVNLRLGWLSYRMGRYKNSLKHYEQAVQIGPDAIEAKLGLLLPMLVQERFQEAEQICYQILHIDYYNYVGNMDLIYALRGQDKTELARKVVEKMLVRYPANVGLLTQLAQLYQEQDQAEQALRTFRDVSILDPENVLAKEFLHDHASSPKDDGH